MMDLSDIKEALAKLEPDLPQQPFVVWHTFARDGQTLHVALTERLRKKCRKEGVWKAREMLITLKNASYGFDEQQARSVCGRDGIFLLDRDFRPVNAMMQKLFVRYLDKPNSGARELLEALSTTLADVRPVRLVSHHMRLLGILVPKPESLWLVLVDCDRTE